MTNAQFSAISSFREEFHEYCKKLTADFGEILRPLQKSAAKNDTPEYPIENPIVYNSALDTLDENSQIRLILIGDNPGKNEQLSKNQKYLVGQSGKIASNFFAKNSQFYIDFQKNVIILNKTPIHTAKTQHLRKLASDSRIAQIIEESQLWFAQKTAQLHSAFDEAELWLVGYGELKKRGIFAPYRDALKSAERAEDWARVRVFQHFSMNCFLNDLRRFMKENENLSILEAAKELGIFHRDEIFGKFGT